MGVNPTSTTELHFPEVIIDIAFSRAVPALSLSTGGDQKRWVLHNQQQISRTMRRTVLDLVSELPL